MTPGANIPHIGLVVEGKGEVTAIPLLLRNWLHQQGEFRDLLGKPFSLDGKGNATCQHGIEGAVVAVANRPGCKGVLVELDADRDLACQLGPDLQKRAATVCRRVPVAVCVAEVKYESWLVASAESMELESLDFEPDRNPEALIKEALRPIRYIKTTWQARLTGRMNLELARSRSPSLTRLLDACMGYASAIPPGAEP